MSTLERAIEIAARAHAGEREKNDLPYILHPLRVMLAQRDDTTRVVAALHDVVEKSDVGLDTLRAEGFASEVISAVDALSRRDGEDYFAFVERAGAHPVARPVKIADLRDNVAAVSARPRTNETSEKLARYRQALNLLGVDDAGAA